MSPCGESVYICFLVAPCDLALAADETRCGHDEGLLVDDLLKTVKGLEWKIGLHGARLLGPWRERES